MIYTNIQAIILAAGKSTRFNTETSKLAETICGQPMILFTTKLLTALKIPTTVVTGHHREAIESIISQEHGTAINFVVQEKQEGTGHALSCTKHLWDKENILVINADCPLVTTETVTALYTEHLEKNSIVSFVTACNPDPTNKSYGRIVKNENRIEIVEAKDFTGNPSEHCCINAGIYLISKDFLLNYIATLNDNNASKEFYITDLIKIASDNNKKVTTIKAPFDTIRGVNTLQELWAIEQIKRSELIKHWMDNGVRFSLAQNVHVDLNVAIGQGSYIGCGVHLKGNTSIGKNCAIHEFSSLENVIIQDNTIINQHCILKNTHIESNMHIGPLVYMKNNITLHSPHDSAHNFDMHNTTINTQTAKPCIQKNDSSKPENNFSDDTFSFVGARMIHHDIPTDEQ
jgi:bifunctional UDP-N-acetylglucosamine pyrophosphorylase/glucosamine-1-phosphate N-acetyltransferase